MPKFVSLIREVRGNALWDFIKWSVLGVLAMVGIAVTAIVQRWRGIPYDLLGILIVGGVWILALTIAYVIGRLWKRKSPPQSSDPPSATQSTDMTPAGSSQVRALNDRIKGMEEEIRSLKSNRKRAEIKGEIREGSFTQEGGVPTYTVKVRVLFYNRGELTTLRGFKLKVSHPRPAQTWESRGVHWGDVGNDMENLAKLLNQKPPYDLVPGKHIDGWLQFRVVLHGHTYAELFDPTLIITDGFGDDHEITSNLTLRRTR